ncbi:MAG: septum formation initiator family protein [Lachnospiraceae bacterium]|nr:septum formation initiator family protein [Lachnospiraceae bacterium]
MEKRRRKPGRRYSRRISAKEQKRRIRLTIMGISLLLVLTAGVLIFQTGRMNHQKDTYLYQSQQLQSDIEEEEARSKELLKKKMEVTADSYIEAEARKRLGLVYKDEVLIKRK